ncbi:Sortase family protein [Geodermatophilus dictyosporus]|uniref:Sortase family protein n=1 Tax=Geodermatophilus dictyosporus TaxID=1523247 RepID=A0A1I5JTJ3_9ACTN|nr:class F sortase [Geodermatophilus dictyosporus]SFO75646.1 Sortase family protein [Geodermatophilus dictyosporus]
MTEPPARRRSRTWLVLAAVLAVVGVGALVVALTGQRSAPTPAAAPTAVGSSAVGSSAVASSAPSTVPPPTPPPAPDTTPADAPADVAEPVSVGIPEIGVSSDLLRLGLNDDGTVEVPPLAPDDRAGWYENGPAPGAVGPAVLLGHVDSAEWGPGVFFDLGALAPGDEVEVSRADGTVAVFAVDRVERHAKDDFPTVAVYGNTDDAQLRLITCGGAFDPGAGSYEDNVVAFATLVGTRPA